MTHGDLNKVKCPAGRKSIPRPLGDEKVTPGEIREFIYTCPICSVPIYYWARWAVVVDAERKSKVK